MVAASILLDTVSAAGARITTFELKLPKTLLAQLNTHRVFSRSAASSRAIPVTRTIQMALEDPVIPLLFGKNAKGMQANGKVDDERQVHAIWLQGLQRAVETATALKDCGLHKQHANRVLEPYLHAKVILTSTTFDNFFKLRCSPHAQPEMEALACEMRDKLAASVPVQGFTHVPMLTLEDQQRAEARIALGDIVLPSSITRHFAGGAAAASGWLISAGRCARVSYLTHDGRRDIGEDIRLALDLIRDGHWSPYEHQAYAFPDKTSKSGNFTGWRQLRKGLER